MLKCFLMIVFDDANLELALEGVLWGAFGTTGQRCTATSRLILQKGIHDNFLDLGGQSMLAIRCLSAMRQLFRVEVPLRIMFETANLEELAQALTAYEDQPGKLEKIARVLQKVKGVSREELQNQLRQRRASKLGIKEDA